MTSATARWRMALSRVMAHGKAAKPLSPGGDWKGNQTREILGFQTVWPMALPVILEPARKLGYRFMAAEAAWICSGDNQVRTIAPFSKNINRFSDDGRRFFGAYGPKVLDQLSYAVKTLKTDPASRQAVINIWREQPPITKDTPCTLSLQFLLREDGLNCVATMRSSDLWTGVPYDIFTFSMISAMVALELRANGLTVGLGDLYLTAGSQHIYEHDWADVAKLLDDPIPTVWSSRIKPIALDEFDASDDLVRHLWSLARRDKSGRSGTFLTELYDGKD